MAATVASQTLVDGERNAVLKLQFTCDGTEAASVEAVDVSALSGSPSTVRIDRVKAMLDGFSLTLEWNATANVDALTIPAGESDQDYRDFGGIKNNAGSGVNGDIDFTTLNSDAGENGTVILYLVKE